MWLDCRCVCVWGGGRGCTPEIPSPHACLVPMNFQALNYKTSLSAFVSGKVNKFRYSSNHRRSKSVKAEFSRQKRNVEVKIKAKGKFRTKSCAVSEISSRFRSFKCGRISLLCRIWYFQRSAQIQSICSR